MTVDEDHEPGDHATGAQEDRASEVWTPDGPIVGDEPPVVDPSARPTQLRRERLLPHLDLESGPGLEIGALCAPVVTRDMADVCYVDVQSTEELVEHYRADPSVVRSLMVDVDVPLLVDGEVRSIAAATAQRGPFRWAVACHVVEHVPDMVGWLADLAETLADDGRLGLVVPDRRYTFDTARPPTTTGQLLDAHENRDRRPSLRAVHDHFSATVSVPTAALWRGAVPGPEHRANPPEVLDDALRRFRSTDEYIDCHTWIVTPREFIAQLAELSGLGLLDFVVDHVQTTPVDELEFYVVLRRLPRDAGATVRVGAADFSCPPDEQLPAPPQPPPPPPQPGPPEGTDLRPITDREWALVQRKRSAARPLVRALGAARARLGRVR